MKYYIVILQSILLVFFTVSFFGCSETATPIQPEEEVVEEQPELPDFMPLALGKQWIYNCWDYSSYEITRTTTQTEKIWEIVGVETLDDRTVYKVRVTESGFRNITILWSSVGGGENEYIRESINEIDSLKIIEFDTTGLSIHLTRFDDGSRIPTFDRYGLFPQDSVRTVNWREFGCRDNTARFVRNVGLVHLYLNYCTNTTSYSNWWLQGYPHEDPL